MSGKEIRADDPEIQPRSSHTHLCEECGKRYMCETRGPEEACARPYLCQRCVEAK